MSPKVQKLPQAKTQMAPDLVQATGPALGAPLHDVAEASRQSRADGPFSLHHIIRQKVPKQKHMHMEKSMANGIVPGDLTDLEIDPIPEEIAAKARRGAGKPPSGLSLDKKSKSVVSIHSGIREVNAHGNEPEVLDAYDEEDDSMNASSKKTLTNRNKGLPSKKSKSALRGSYNSSSM